ncbi:MAG: M23 family metallopeptidase [Myxococcota bacterium]
MFKWVVVFGVIAALFIQNRLLNHHLNLSHTYQQRQVEAEWQQLTSEHLNLLDHIGEHFNTRPNRWPVMGTISSHFGFRSDPFTGYQAMHFGVDIAAPYGTPVHASAPGRVIFVGHSGGLGNLVAIQHSPNLITRYGHLSDYFVRSGEWVKRDERIALVGNTGRSTAPHLHYVVEKNGVHQDPVEYLE